MGPIRGAGRRTRIFRISARLSGVTDDITSLLLDVAGRTEKQTVVDLCSRAGGFLPLILMQASEKGFDLTGTPDRPISESRENAGSRAAIRWPTALRTESIRRHECTFEPSGNPHYVHQTPSFPTEER